MQQRNRVLIGIAAGAFAGLLMGGAGMYCAGIHNAPQDGGAEEPQPLYWVAPMDPDYRRDQPGKSPMGMDLVPVYADEGDGAAGDSGTVRIDPAVVNNLGVRTAVATQGTLENTIVSVGYVQYDEDRLVHIHPRVQGWIETLHVKATGDPVTAGQPLYELYSPELVNAQEELQHALKRDNARLIQAAQDRLRALQLSPALIDSMKKGGGVSQTTTFYAPQAGVVDNLDIREGFYVKPGTTLMSIASLEDVWVEAELLERRGAYVAEGTPVTMTVEYLPGRAWEGQVDYVYPSLDALTRTLRVRLRFANEDGVLRPNMFARVVLYPQNDHTGLLVPREAVIRTASQQRVVIALGSGRFKSVAVRTGRFDDANIEVLSGLAEGDEVVTSAQFLLDSESSKTSDFMRMEHTGEMHHD